MASSKIDLRLVAVPIVLLLALGIVYYFNQPQIEDIGKVDYIDVNGDEYLPGEYITPELEGIGETDPNADFGNQEFAATISDCNKKSGLEKESCLLLYAVMTEDEKGCIAIDDQTVRDDCYTRLAGFSKNANLCSNVKIGRQDCYVDVALLTQNPALCENGDYEKRQCFIAAQARDYSLCPEGIFKRYCNNAIAFEDINECNSVESYKELCYSTIARETNNSSLCNKADGEMKNTCFFSIALATNNPQVCENLTDTRDSCVAWIAFNTGDRELCFSAGSQAQECVEDIDYEYGQQ